MGPKKKNQIRPLLILSGPPALPSWSAISTFILRRHVAGAIHCWLVVYVIFLVCMNAITTTNILVEYLQHEGW